MEKDIKSDSGDELLCSKTKKSLKDLFEKVTFSLELFSPVEAELIDIAEVTGCKRIETTV